MDRDVHGSADHAVVVADRGCDGTHTGGQLLIGERPTLGSNPDELSPELSGGRLGYRR